MKGAREYRHLFNTGQIGRLYLVVSTHARGCTFKIFVLPDGEKAVPNGESNPPLNKDAVEVYGVVSGNPGWTESYGWLHQGKWQEDFKSLVHQRSLQLDAKNKDKIATQEERYLDEQFRVSKLLGDYA